MQHKVHIRQKKWEINIEEGGRGCFETLVYDFGAKNDSFANNFVVGCLRTPCVDV
jgi:hypothetical protein